MNKKIRFIIIIVLIVCTTSLQLYAQKNRELLKEFYQNPKLSSWILSSDKWAKFPLYKDRKAWQKLPFKIKKAAIKNGEKYIGFSWPAIPASTFLDYVRTGSRESMQIFYRERKKAIEALVLAELVEGKGRFLDAIINGVWAYCELTYWGLSAHLTMQRKGTGLPDLKEPTIDLGVGDIGANLAWIYYYFKDTFEKINPLINERIKNEITNKVLTPFYNRDDFWWMGFNNDFVNNWNPWCNYNVLTCIMLVEEDKQQQRLGIRKTMRSVDQFINYYKDDGGCEEGPTYWGHAGGKLFEVLELLYQITDGKITLYDNELIKNIGRYIYRAYIADSYFINFADAGAKSHSNPGIIYRYGKRIKDNQMMGFGSFLAKKHGWAEGEIPLGKIDLTLKNFFGHQEILANKPIQPLISHFWLPETQIMGARDKAGTTKGFYFAAKGGYNQESHNHNDAGTFVLYFNGKPCLVDAGVGTYTKKTFGKQRYSIWTMQSQYHNLPKINEVDQKFGKKFKATNCKFKANSKSVSFSTQIATAYPKEAAVKSWVRFYELKRGKKFKITDTYELLSIKGKTTINFLTSCKIDASISGKLKLTGDGFSLWLAYDNSKMSFSKEVIPITDKKLKKSWPKGLTRLVFEFRNIKQTGKSVFSLSE